MLTVGIKQPVHRPLLLGVDFDIKVWLWVDDPMMVRLLEQLLMGLYIVINTG